MSFCSGTEMSMMRRAITSSSPSKAPRERARTRHWGGAPREKSLLKRPHLGLVGAGCCGEHGEIVAGQDQGHALVGVELQQLLAVGTAHARPLAVLATSGDDLFAGPLDLGIRNVTRDAHLHG